jgi:ribonuclease BN (tRNA processing enzyme)
VPQTTRRNLLRHATSVALIAAAGVNPVLAGAAARTRLVLLGTAGGPRPRKTRSASAQAIVVGDAIYVIDCGDGVARQMVQADLPLASIRGVFVTHHHSDHQADYGNLLLLAWTAGLRTPVDTFGPPPLEKMTRQFLGMNEADIGTRIADEGRPPLAPLVRAHDITRSGNIFSDENVKVTAALVDHPPLTAAFAYRLDSADRSIVISGDTKVSPSLIGLARGADVLVHEAIIPSAVDRLIRNVPNAPDLKRSILSHHTAAEDVGRVADAAGVHTLVLSHLIPAEDPEVTEAHWRQAASRHFKGEIIIGRDLLVL